ncbi:YbaY family lipoprotein [Yersinia nurmii]|uniref:YbaY family lipoprotein n=1 Tax=Yersinia nurmii TaxID=685706 RepID=A0AAW7K5Z0_9GAMM|nr:YbaY family lipoprotein [Yersinia nurmii]MDN0088870.1 YbaY family lipoprotein [Yersinia nurmii]CNF08052.1 Uncharacterised protein [Yersinia nurmii]
MYFTFKKHYSSVPLFIATLLCLTGCSISNDYFNSSFSIDGEVSSSIREIPENSRITITVSNKNPEETTDRVIQEFIFLTQKLKRNQPFRMKIAEKILMNEKNIQFSVRVEHDDELIMMSDKIVAIQIDKHVMEGRKINRLLLTVTQS